MHIDYTVTPEDLITFNIYVNRSSALFRHKRRKSLLVFSLIASVLFIIAYFVQRNLVLALVLFFAALSTLTIGVTTYVAV